jgi:hypothetical protein
MVVVVLDARVKVAVGTCRGGLGGFEVEAVVAAFLLVGRIVLDTGRK